ncbi:MAG: hypothetical protein QM487_04105 [Candidatus Marithrix sp.]
MVKIISSDFNKLVYGCLFFIILLLTTLLYWQSLYGIFIFDDIPNLQELANIGKFGNSITQFVIGGEAGILGRPVSLLTFALQADSWPFNPWDFKYVNLMIHLLNGCLIFWFILIISHLIKLPEKHCLLLALLTASIWLLHPIQVSTVSYVVQRMTQLTTLFTLIGILTYLNGRQLLAQKKLKSGLLWISIGVGLGGILATLSKENGILLVLYIIVLEITILRNLPKPSWYSIWASFFLYFPLILLSLYFIINIDSLLQAYQIREFTMGERLLTQSRILTDYIAKILLFKVSDFGLFHDDFIISHSLLEPLTTIFAIIFLGTTLTLAIIVRSKLPILSFGILFFFAGHILESSFIGLMLYFEHRNYLPMLGIVFVTAYAFIKLFDYLINPFIRKIVFSISLILFFIFPLLTWVQTGLWGNPLKQTVLWVHQHPNSPAAQAQGIVFFQGIGQYEIAENYAKNMMEASPQSDIPYLYLINLACNYEQVKMPNLETVIQHAKTSKYSHVTLILLTSIIEKKDNCSIESSKIDKLFNVLINNPNNKLYQAHFYYRYALFLLSENHYKAAIKNGKQALALKESIHLRIKMIKWLTEDKQFNEAMIFLQETEMQLNPIQQNIYHKELTFFKTKIPVTQELHEMGFDIQ